jgi:hypothetical protein
MKTPNRNATRFASGSIMIEIHPDKKAAGAAAAHAAAEELRRLDRYRQEIGVIFATGAQVSTRVRDTRRSFSRNSQFLHVNLTTRRSMADFRSLLRVELGSHHLRPGRAKYQLKDASGLHDFAPSEL